MFPPPESFPPLQRPAAALKSGGNNGVHFSGVVLTAVQIAPDRLPRPEHDLEQRQGAHPRAQPDHPAELGHLVRRRPPGRHLGADKEVGGQADGNLKMRKASYSRNCALLVFCHGTNQRNVLPEHLAAEGLLVVRVQLRPGGLEPFRPLEESNNKKNAEPSVPFRDVWT